jgi:hypothetical protein
MSELSDAALEALLNVGVTANASWAEPVVRRF